MKYLLIFATLTFILISCSTKGFKNDISFKLHNNLNGPVKSMSFETFKVDSFNDGEIITGSRTRCKSFSPGGSDYSTGNYSWVFTSNGDLKELIVSGTRGQMNNKLIHFYNKKNQVISTEITDYSKNITTRTEVYYKGFETERIITDEKNKTIKKNNQLYDKYNRLISIKSVDSNNRLLSKSKYKYRGDIRIASFYDENDELKSTAKTDSKGKILERISGQKLYYQYDDSGFLFSIRVKNYLSRNIIYKYKNDEFGNVVSAEKWQDNSLVDSFNFKYEYDQNKNWTKRIMFEDENPIAICIRKFQYY